MALRCTVPNPKLHPNLWPVTFIFCIFWIGGNSYMVSWMVTLVGRFGISVQLNNKLISYQFLGSVLNIPSTVQGMTFVAAGGSLPESLSIAIMTRRGKL